MTFANKIMMPKQLIADSVMKSIIRKTINDSLNEYILNPYGYPESRQNHEIFLHYLFHDNFFRNYRQFEYLFRYEYPTYQTYKRQKIGKCATKKLFVNADGDPGNFDIAIINFNQKQYQIEYGIEFGLFDCDTPDCDFEIHTDNDILKLSDKKNNVSNKILIYFFRCNDFVKTTKGREKARVDTVIKRGEKFRTILSTKLNQIDLLNIIFIELYVINGKIETIVTDFHIPKKDRIVENVYNDIVY